jgi:hypothetical protein
MNFNFGEVLNRAWRITWKYKILWIFGILASCSRGGGGGSGGGGNGGSNGNGNSPFDTSGMERFFSQVGDYLVSHWWVIVLIILGVILLVLLSIFLGTIGRIGLIRGTLQAEEGAERLSFGELFRGSMPFFWRVFGLTFLIGLISTLLFLPLILFGVLTAGIGFLCMLPLMCLLIPISIVIYLIVEHHLGGRFPARLGTHSHQRGDDYRHGLDPAGHFSCGWIRFRHSRHHDRPAICACVRSWSGTERYASSHRRPLFCSFAAGHDFSQWRSQHLYGCLVDAHLPAPDAQAGRGCHPD